MTKMRQHRFYIIALCVIIFICIVLGFGRGLSFSRLKTADLYIHNWFREKPDDLLLVTDEAYRSNFVALLNKSVLVNHTTDRIETEFKKNSIYAIFQSGFSRYIIYFDDPEKNIRLYDSKNTYPSFIVIKENTVWNQLYSAYRFEASSLVYEELVRFIIRYTPDEIPPVYEADVLKGLDSTHIKVYLRSSKEGDDEPYGYRELIDSDKCFRIKELFCKGELYRPYLEEFDALAGDIINNADVLMDISGCMITIDMLVGLNMMPSDESFENAFFLVERNDDNKIIRCYYKMNRADYLELCELLGINTKP